jgi:excinuclease ABC subunit A
VVKKDDVKDVLEAISHLKEGSRIYLLAAFRTLRNRDAREELNILMQKGFSRIYVSPFSHTQKENPVDKGTIYRIEELLVAGSEDFKTALNILKMYMCSSTGWR